jgi:hypothetical protein
VTGREDQDEMRNPSIISERTRVTITLAIAFGGGLFILGYQKSQIDALATLPQQVAIIREDVSAMRAVLGIPRDHRRGSIAPTSSEQEDTTPMRPQPPTAPRRTVAFPEGFQ